MNREEHIKMWEAAAMEKKREMGPHDKAMSDIIGRAKAREAKGGKPLTPSETAALDRHRQNARNAEKKN